MYQSRNLSLSIAFIISSICLIFSIFYSHNLWVTSVFLSKPKFQILLDLFSHSNFSTQLFSLFLSNYIFFLLFSTTTGHVDRKLSLILVSPESLFCQFAPATNKKTCNQPRNRTGRSENKAFTVWMIFLIYWQEKGWDSYSERPYL